MHLTNTKVGFVLLSIIYLFGCSRLQLLHPRSLISLWHVGSFSRSMKNLVP